MVHCDMFHIVQYCRELAPYYIIDERTQEPILTDLDTVVSEDRKRAAWTGTGSRSRSIPLWQTWN